MTSDPERALVAERILAEQEERRRLAELIHDGPVQHLAAIGQIVDAALEAVREGDRQRAAELLTRGLQVTREAGQDLRALCEDLEPRALRELGFAAAVEAFGRRVAGRRDIEIAIDVEHGDALGEHAQAGLFQIVRDAVDQAVRRGALTTDRGVAARAATAVASSSPSRTTGRPSGEAPCSSSSPTAPRR